MTGEAAESRPNTRLLAKNKKRNDPRSKSYRNNRAISLLKPAPTVVFPQAALKWKTIRPCRIRTQPLRGTVDREDFWNLPSGTLPGAMEGPREILTCHFRLLPIESAYLLIRLLPLDPTLVPLTTTTTTAVAM